MLRYQFPIIIKLTRKPPLVLNDCIHRGDRIYPGGKLPPGFHQHHFFSKITIVILGESDLSKPRSLTPEEDKGNKKVFLIFLNEYVNFIKKRDDRKEKKAAISLNKEQRAARLLCAIITVFILLWERLNLLYCLLEIFQH